MQETPLPPSSNKPPPPDVPSWQQSILWLGIFIFAYLFGYELYFSFCQLSIAQFNPGISPSELRLQLQAHLLSLNGLVGMSLVRFILLMPLILSAAHFAEQPWYETLALRKVKARQLLHWGGIWLAYALVFTFLESWFDVADSENLQPLLGSRHWGIFFVIVVIGPLWEETLFRGYLYRAWRHSRLGVSGSIALSSLLFTLFHVGQVHFIEWLQLFVFAFMLGIARWRSHSLLLPLALHALHNLVGGYFIIFQAAN